MENEWDYSSEYCEACAELGMTTCSCEPDGFEEDRCYQCDEEGHNLNWNGLCDDCQEENEEAGIE